VRTTQFMASATAAWIATGEFAIFTANSKEKFTE
jgi:hypothetical protein